MRNISEDLFRVRKSFWIQLWPFIVVQQMEEQTKIRWLSMWGEGGQNFSLCGDHKWMTPKWKDYRNPCKDLKFLICALHVSKPSDFIFTFCCWFLSYILFCFCFGFSNIGENILTCIMWATQEACYQNFPNIMRSKKFMYEVFWCREAAFQCSSKHF